jgi:dipeptidyl aminopeptidase/acylaminoacyl peptidase
VTRSAPYGSWRSPIGATLVASASAGLGWLAVDGEAVCWLETRPDEGGRGVVMRWRPDEGVRELTPPPWNVRTRVHEYGGGAFAVAGGLVCFSHVLDDRLYVLEGGEAPRAVTPSAAWRFADGVIDRGRRVLVCVGEDHGAAGEPVNRLVRIGLDGVAPPVVVAEGHDFYAAPRLSPDGTSLAWLAWRHPDMPWDGTELWLARVDGAGALVDARHVAGGRDESILEPSWTPDGHLHVMSDRSGWWNLHRLESGGDLRALCPVDADCARPPWVFGQSHHGVLDDGGILVAWTRDGSWRLGRVSPGGGALDAVDTPYTEIAFLREAPGGAVFVGASPTARPAVVRFDARTGRVAGLRPAATDAIDRALVSVPEPFTCPSADGRLAHGLHYAPRNPAYEPPGGRPPLIVRCHGGPTAAASTALDPVVQFWTSRGFAVLDVNYAGSSGYGRSYRRLLDGAWGVVDVEDCVAAARHAVARGWADPDRLVVRGSSAGGFTVLCALAFHDVFAAGTSCYGIGDLEALRRDTHKFESYYDQRLVGPYPARRDLYLARSPLHAADAIRKPVLFLQGLDDRVVPPGQSEAMTAALRKSGVRADLVLFPGEGHGFRRAESIVRALESECAFYRDVLGLAPEEP